MVGLGRVTAQRFFDIAVRRLVSSISTWNANVDWKRIGMMPNLPGEESALFQGTGHIVCGVFLLEGVTSTLLILAPEKIEIG